MLSTFIKLPFFTKTFVLSIFKWPLKTGFTELTTLCIKICAMLLQCRKHEPAREDLEPLPFHFSHFIIFFSAL